MPGPIFEPAAEWSTDTNYPAGSDPWNGNAARVAPSGGQHAAGLEPGDTLPAPWWNYFIGRLTAWVAYLRGFVNEVTDEFAYPVPKTRVVELIPTEAKGSWVPHATESFRAVSTEDSGRATWNLRGMIPVGAVITHIQVSVTTGANRGGLDDTRVLLRTLDYDYVAGGAQSSTSEMNEYFAGAPGDYALTFTPSHTVLEAEQLMLAVWSGDDGGAHNTDTLHAVQITFTDPGPRNG